ncbi:MAG: single-stranded DNA-binding protein [Parcubacteria group bacterium CG23_combo_of_CG06-09_8_20_14_all_35_9]|nr:MAG: single-stranded DNA-binding protein [Parcubacteria group bacterium CG23_combo_of_CG06-09_8_20_14_all_35_9]
MRGLNKAMIIGNLTRDPEIRTTPSGQSVTSFTVATNFVWTDQSGQKQEKVEYHNVVAWRRLAEIIGQYLRRGSKVYIDGRLQTRDWIGQDGVKRYRTEIIAENMVMLDSRGTSIEAKAPPETLSTESESPSQEEPKEEEEEEIEVEKIPF